MHLRTTQECSFATVYHSLYATVAYPDIVAARQATHVASGHSRRAERRLERRASSLRHRGRTVYGQSGQQRAAVNDWDYETLS